MKAIRIHEPTGISGLVFEEAPDAKPMFCEVLVKVAACGITHNELDWPIWTCRAGHQRTSIIPGHEVSGVVAALGFGTAGIAVGDEVFGLTDQLRDGAAAEYVAVEARNVAPKPQTVDHVHAAAVPRVGLTAWQALFDHGKLAKGQTVVIHGAGGAVGSTAVQLARWAGAEVIGTGRSHSRPLATELGADRFIALDADRLEDAAGQADLVLDTIGGEVLARPPAARGNAGHDQGRRAAARQPGRHQDGPLHPGVQPRSADRTRPPGRPRGTSAPRSARSTRSRKQPRRTARRPQAASPAGSSSSPDPGP
jgi:NADPH:quinone reductase-like Zn-dependent oxidoreductase